MKERRGGKREERYENIRRINEGVGRASRQSIRTYRFRWWFFSPNCRSKSCFFCLAWAHPSTPYQGVLRSNEHTHHRNNQEPTEIQSPPAIGRLGMALSPIKAQRSLACFGPGGEPQPRASVEARSKPGSPPTNTLELHSFSETVERVDRGDPRPAGPGMIVDPNYLFTEYLSNSYNTNNNYNNNNNNNNQNNNI